jgi:hypothetical protein
MDKQKSRTHQLKKKLFFCTNLSYILGDSDFKFGIGTNDVGASGPENGT